MTVDAKLAAVRAKRALVAAARNARNEQRGAELQLESELQGLADDEAIARYEVEIGPIGKQIMVVDTDMGAIILKRAHALKFKKFQDKGQQTHEAAYMLAQPCVVYPDSARFDVIVDALPATTIRCANAVAVLAGVRSEEIAPK